MMLKKLILIALAVTVTVTFTNAAFSMDKGNKRKGKYIYRKVYTACFERGEVDVAKPPVNPDAKTQAEWTSVFDQKSFEEFGCQDEWSSLSDEDLSHIYAYMHDHAADSPTPLKCK
jgi:hypothetical protein